ncbi:MAG: hypothetical protein ACK5Y2_08520 [Bdellovibrionales bacterium]
MTVNTLITCSKATPTESVQAGLLPHSSGAYRLLVVQRKAGRAARTLIANRQVNRFDENRLELYVMPTIRLYFF